MTIQDVFSELGNPTEPIEDQEGRRAAARLREQLELFPDDVGRTEDCSNECPTFDIRPCDLRDACSATNLFWGRGEQELAVADLEISPTRLRLATQRRSLTCRVSIPLMPGSTDISAKGQGLSLPHVKLHRLFRLFAKPKNQLPLVRCSYNLDQSEWVMRERESEIRLTTLPFTTSPDLWGTSENSGVPVDPKVLRETLLAAKLLARPRPLNKAFSNVEINGGVAIGGDEPGVILCKLAALAPIKFRVPTAEIAPLCTWSLEVIIWI
jgi:hypothetical protein